MKISVEIGKRKFNCPVGLEFLGECLENLDLDVNQIIEKLDKNPFKWIPALMYESIKLEKGGELNFTTSDLIKWLDEDGQKGQKTMNSFLLSFVKAMTKDVPKSDNVESDGEPKKK